MNYTTDIVVGADLPGGSSPILDYSIENPSTPLTDPGIDDILIESGGVSASGVRVTHQSALTYPPVLGIVSMISGDIAKLPLELYKNLPGDDVTIDFTHPARFIVRRRPNKEMHAFRFWRRMMTYALLWNNAYALIDFRGGRPHGLLPLLPDRTSVFRINGDLFFAAEIDGRLHTFFPDEILHIDGISLDNEKGRDQLKMARDAWGLGLAEMQFGSKFFKHGGTTGGILELPTGISKTARDTIEEGFKLRYDGLDNAFKTVILRDNAKFHAAQIKPEEGQMVESRKESVRDAARTFKIRPGKIGEESSTVYGNKYEDNRDYLDTTLGDWLCNIQSECQLKLLTDEEQRSESHYFEHVTEALLTMNPLQRYQLYEIGIRSEILSPNEARRKEKLNRRDDDRGDEYRNPNVNPADRNRNERVDRAHRELLSSAIDRVLLVEGRKAARMSPDDFDQWLATGCGNLPTTIEKSVAPVIAAHAGLYGDIDPKGLVESATQKTLSAVIAQFKQATNVPSIETTFSDLVATTGSQVARVVIGGSDEKQKTPAF